jgi:DNA primase
MSGQFVCWRCGFMPLIEAIKRLTGKSWTESKRIARKYGGTERTLFKHVRTDKERDIDVEFPIGTLDYIPKRHRKYLESRDFDPDQIVETWSIKAAGKLGGFSERIIIPITYNNRLVSYTSRAIDPNEKVRYRTCTKEFERRHHKHCLYGLDFAVGKSVLVLEGPMDVWRFGIGAVSTFGIKYTEAQVMLLYKNFDRIFTMFDETETEAQQKASQLTAQLSTMGKAAEHITLGVDHDPAELKDEDAKYLMRELLIL